MDDVSDDRRQTRTTNNGRRLMLPVKMTTATSHCARGFFIMKKRKEKRNTLRTTINSDRAIQLFDFASPVNASTEKAVIQLSQGIFNTC